MTKVGGKYGWTLVTAVGWTGARRLRSLALLRLLRPMKLRPSQMTVQFKIRQESLTSSIKKDLYRISNFSEKLTSLSFRNSFYKQIPAASLCSA